MAATVEEPVGAPSTLAPTEREVTPHQRFVERLTTWLGRPAVLYVVFAGVAAWIGVNLALTEAGLPAADPPDLGSSPDEAPAQGAGDPGPPRG